MMKFNNFIMMKDGKKYTLIDQMKEYYTSYYLKKSLEVIYIWKTLDDPTNCPDRMS